MLHAHAPGIAPHLFENLQEAGSDKRALVSGDVQKGIIGIRLSGIGDVEVYDFVAAGLWDAAGDPFDQIAMGINERAAATREDVLDDHGLQECRFADAGFADHVQMGKPVDLLDAKRIVAIAGVGAGDDGGGVIVSGHAIISICKGVYVKVGNCAFRAFLQELNTG